MEALVEEHSARRRPVAVPVGVPGLAGSAGRGGGGTGSSVIAPRNLRK
jgi:hypothetical protein